jgi:hypothetical protein
MVGVFFMSSRIKAVGLDDCSIYLFDSEDQAKEFIFGKLVDEGEIDIDDSDYVVDGERFDSRDDAVEAVRDAFDMMEFFHVYPVVDHRTENSAKIESE